MPGLAQASRGLGPAEDLLDALPDDLAGPVAGMPGGAAVDGGSFCFSRDVGRDVDRAQFVDEVLGVIALVGAERDAPNKFGTFRARLRKRRARQHLAVGVVLGVLARCGPDASCPSLRLGPISIAALNAACAMAKSTVRATIQRRFSPVSYHARFVKWGSGRRRSRAVYPRGRTKLA